MSKKKRKFKRQNSHKIKRVPESWRKPRGKHSPMRRKEAHAPKMPNKGFQSPEDERGLHPSGLEEVLVHTPNELDELEADEHAVRIGTSVGGRKREQIADKAEELELTVLNYREPVDEEVAEEDTDTETETQADDESADETDGSDDDVQNDDDEEE